MRSFISAGLLLAAALTSCVRPPSYTSNKEENERREKGSIAPALDPTVRIDDLIRAQAEEDAKRSK